VNGQNISATSDCVGFISFGITGDILCSYFCNDLPQFPEVSVKYLRCALAKTPQKGSATTSFCHSTTQATVPSHLLGHICSEDCLTQRLIEVLSKGSLGFCFIFSREKRMDDSVLYLHLKDIGG